VLTVYPGGKQLGAISEFRKVVIGALGAIGTGGGFVSLLRVGGCINGGQPMSGDRAHWVEQRVVHRVHGGNGD
jgi:hypothetical protein